VLGLVFTTIPELVQEKVLGTIAAILIGVAYKWIGVFNSTMVVT
jgi:hypothetical protein